MKRALIAVVLLAAPAALLAAPAHEHGTAHLDVVVDGGLLSISLDSPLDHLAGFEHAPRNDRQRAALAKAAGTLGNGGALFRPSPEAGCTPGEAAVDLPYADSGAKRAETGDGHADATARWTFRCARPESLRGVEVGLFEAFPALRRLRVQLATPRGQSAASLTPKRRELAW